MKTTVVCGILGAGKTTFIQNVLSAPEARTVVLVNDFGRSGIDGEIFSHKGIESVELPSGCVCCTLKGDLVATLRVVVAERRPEHLFIEPSGIASPAGVIEALGQVPISPVMVVGIVDATEFAELYEAELYGRFFEEQVSLADLVLVNKSDLAGPDKTARSVDLARRLNPTARVAATVDALLGVPLSEIPPRTESSFRPPLGASNHRISHETLSLDLGDNIVHGEMSRLFERLTTPEFGNIVRAKALLNTDLGPCRFDLASGAVRSEFLPATVRSSRLVVIGNRLDEPRLRDTLGQ